MVFNSQNLMRGRGLVTVCALAVALFPVIAQAQAGDVDTRLSRMERDIDTISRTVYKGQKPTGSLPGQPDVNAAALQQQMDDRLNSLEQDLRNLTGQMEAQGNVLNQVKAQMDRTVMDLQSRVGTIEQKLGIGAVATTMPSTSAAAPLSGTAGAVVGDTMPPAPS